MPTKMIVAAVLLHATEAKVLSHKTTQQGRCRQNYNYGGYCGCGPIVSAAACFNKASEWHELAAAQYRTSDKTCFLMHAWAHAPFQADCPSECTATSGNATVEFYTGDGDADNVCLTSWPTSPALTVQKGACLVEGKYGGGCECPGRTSSSDCFNHAEHWFPLSAAQWQANSGSCKLLHLQKNAPADCPLDCSAFEGNDDHIQFYVGNGDVDSTCLSAWWSPSWTVQKGSCQQDANVGGHCDCSPIANFSMTHCFELAQKWDAVSASEYITNTRCLLLQQVDTAPLACPEGCDAIAGSGTVDFYVGDGAVEGFCMTARREALIFGQPETHVVETPDQPDTHVVKTPDQLV